MMDLDRYDTRPASEAGVWVTLRDPVTGAPLPARVHVRGQDSRAWQEVLLAQRRARLERAEKTGRMALDPAEVDEEDIERLVAITIGWEGISRGGAQWPCTPENAREFYRGWPEFRAQVVEVVARRANFLPPSVTDCSRTDGGNSSSA